MLVLVAQVLGVVAGGCSGGGGTTDGGVPADREPPEELRLAVGGEPEDG